jgi:hypothetical protein
MSKLKHCTLYMPSASITLTALEKELRLISDIGTNTCTHEYAGFNTRTCMDKFGVNNPTYTSL